MTDVPSTYITRQEFEARMRIVESEVTGEKAVSRHILEQTRRNGDELAVLKSRVDYLTDDVAVIKATLNHHGALLNVLTQDVAMMRQDVAAIRAAVVPREPPRQ